MFGYRRRRSPLLWRMLKAAAAGGAVYWMVRTPEARHGASKEKRVSQARERLKANAQRALAMKMRAPKPFRPESRTANEGMHSTPNEGIAPSGAIEAEGFRVALERSHRAR